MPAAKFKAQCLNIMDEVERTGQTIVITKRGKAVAQLKPMVTRPKHLRGFYKGRIRIIGDILAPLDIPWDADQ